MTREADLCRSWRPGDRVVLAYDSIPHNVYLNYVCLGAGDTFVFADDYGVRFLINVQNKNLRWMRKVAPLPKEAV